MKKGPLSRESPPSIDDISIHYIIIPGPHDGFYDTSILFPGYGGPHAGFYDTPLTLYYYSQATVVHMLVFMIPLTLYYYSQATVVHMLVSMIPLYVILLFPGYGGPHAGFYDTSIHYIIIPRLRWSTCWFLCC